MANKKLIPLRLIRIVKNMDAKEMATYFDISTPYISSMENGNRKINEDILERGLNNLGIDIKEYQELESFCNDLAESELNYQDKYRYALMKALGVVEPGFKSETEAFLRMSLISSSLEITTYIKQAQEYEVIEIDGSLLITPKKTEESKKPKYLSLHKLGITKEEYKDLETRFNSISKLELKDDSKCKLLLVIGTLNPKCKDTTEKMVTNIINSEPNKVKKI